MLTNLLRPWILARLLLSGAVVVVGSYALVVALRVLLQWRSERRAADQLELERRAELVAAVVQVVLGLALGGLALTLLLGERMSDSIRGAMCAYGVFSSADHGFWALGTSVAATMACGLWMVLHRLDLRTVEPRLTRRKFAALLGVVPLLWADLYATLRFALELDLEVVASCCSTMLDARSAGFDTMAPAGPRTLSAGLALGAALVSIALAYLCAKRPRRGWRVSVALSSTLAAALSLPAVIWFVAPHAYETPHHLCPFCLLGEQGAYLGWPLLAGLLSATVLGLGLAVVEGQRRATADPAAVAAITRALARSVALSWSVVVVVGIWPVLRYAWLSGGASLFGG